MFFSTPGDLGDDGVLCLCLCPPKDGVLDFAEDLLPDFLRDDLCGVFLALLALLVVSREGGRDLLTSSLGERKESRLA